MEIGICQFNYESIEVYMPELSSPPTWWAVARSEEVSAAKPLSVDVGEQPIVLWRDPQGQVRALEDRCPHRRAPLSLGCIRSNGWIQCGYHGWSYDGASGRLTEIPNMKDKQKFPALYKATAFAVQESAGFVRVTVDPASAAGADGLPAAAHAAALPLSGTVHVAVDHAQYIAALFDDPGLLIALRGIRFTPYLMSELHVEEGWLCMERSCQWRLWHWPAPFSPEFPATLLSATHPVTGETRLTLRDAALHELFRATLAPVPAARGVTAVRWRAERKPAHRGLHGWWLGAGNPLTVHDAVDAAALRVLKPSVSIRGAELRAQLQLSNAAMAA
jgi:nitrite reductase/ring-hydroxylating ferredoxin subunit